MMWSKEQKQIALSCFLGWTLDAFDFFLMVFILKDIAASFNVTVVNVTVAIMLTLAMRPLGAFIFGRLADRFGRRPILMINILSYAILEFLSGFSPNLLTLLVLRALFGIAMGGEWGVGAALAIESVPISSRGLMSGLLQTGYPTGYLLASLFYGLFYNMIGWRGLFMVGILPALLVVFIRRNVPESSVWKSIRPKHKGNFVSIMLHEWRLVIFTILLMTAFNFLSHGTQDLYPTFLQVQHQLDVHHVSMIAMIYNTGAIIGGLLFGRLSESLGRRYTILIAVLLVLIVLPLWAFSQTLVMLILGAFFMQVAVQGAWGVIPAYLNEMSPSLIRATFPGLVYQFGNLLASVNAPIQVMLTIHFNGNYSAALALVCGLAALIIAVMICFAKEKKGIDFAIG